MQTASEQRTAKAAEYGLLPVDTAWTNCPVWMVSKDADQGPALASWDADDTHYNGEDTWGARIGSSWASFLWSDVLGWTESEAVARAAHDRLFAERDVVCPVQSRELAA